MRTASAWSLLTAFTLSVSLMPVIEVGHIILHRFDNPFHHHTENSRKPHHYHTIADHHLKKSQPKGDAAATTQQANFPTFLFGLTEYPIQLEGRDGELILQTAALKQLVSLITSTPPSPPPWR